MQSSACRPLQCPSRDPACKLTQCSAAQVCIDFGLSTQSTLAEDKAVDLYVMERAFSSAHPDIPGMVSLIFQKNLSQAQHVALS